ncbi:VCBS repeat-containing protein [Methylomicrobium album BG8]|uniref:VCBS repeat-containing protein n=1 Tax=Methylomicrobium album BG8 TaxID=686340 RepID=H8GIF2_METAL|nr:VCBS repeat-containing protein [Methylomicrobium album BG8]
MAKFGIVKFVTGMVKAVSADGTERVLYTGDRVLPDEVIVTADNGNVVIEFNDGTTMDLGRNQQVSLNEDMLSSENPVTQAAGQTAAGAQDEVAAIQQALFDENFDPTKSLQAAAAGGADAGGGTASGGNEGHGTVYVVDYQNPVSQPNSGFDTNGISFSFSQIQENLILNPTLTEGVNNPVIINGIGVTTGDHSILESGLPAGSSPNTEGVTQAGSFEVVALDGIATVTIGGATLTFAQLQDLANNPVTIDTPYGALTLAGFAGGATGGTVSYRYTLDAAVDNDSQAGADNDRFIETVAVTVTDNDGSTANSSINIEIIDDVPDAIDDTNAQAASENQVTLTGNVFTNDVLGADVTANPITPATLTGLYGTLELAADGSYTYTLNPNGEAFLALGGGGTAVETFPYTLTDADGDSDTAILTLNIENIDDNVTITGIGNTAGDETVLESHLPDGTAPDAASLTQTGSFTLDAPDGLQTVTVHGTELSVAQLLNLGAAPVTVTTPQGTLTLTGYTGTAFGGTVDYSYTLNTTVDNSGQSGDFIDTLAVAVTDVDGDSANSTLNIHIVNDVPDAIDDTNAEAANENQVTLTGNVFTNDVLGADVTANPITPATLTGLYGTLELAADGSYTYTLDPNGAAFLALGGGGTATETFPYTLTDADGDSDTAVLTLNIENIDDSVTITGIGNTAGDETVLESHLPDGTAPDAASLTQTGSFTLDAPDGLQTVTVHGTELSVAQLLNLGAAPVTVTTPQGTLTLTGYTGTAFGGTVDYSYTLNNPADNGGQSGDFIETLAVAVTDVDGDSANSTLNIHIVNDVPDAIDDTNAQAASENQITLTGNVFTNDVLGADVTANPITPATLTGLYGTLELAADGSYTYTLDPNGEAFLALGGGGTAVETFPYTLTDADGDSDTAVLTLNIENINNGVAITNLTPAAEGGDVAVNESHLADGSSPNAAALTQPGNFTISAPDGVGNLTIDGHPVITDGVFAATSFTTGLGNTLTITGYDSNTGTVSYTYTLTDNETHAAGQGTNSLFENLDVVLTDLDGDSTQSTLAVNIIDDVPVAVDDVDSIASGVGPATGNVITDAEGDGGADTRGADGAAVTAVASNNIPANSDGSADGSGNFQVAGQYGVLTLHQSGDYSYTRNEGTPGNVSDVFTYTLTDGDGDSATATLTITIGNTLPTIGNLTPAAEGGDVTVNESHLADGSNPNAAALTQPGSFTISAPDGVGNLTIDGHAIISNGAFTAGSFTTGLGNTLTITGYDSNTGTVSYTYTLTDNETHDPVQGTNSLFENLDVVLTDLDGDSTQATLAVNILDDVPVAVDDVDSIASGVGPATGNVITDAEGDGGADTLGADGAAVTAIVSNNPGGAALTEVSAAGVTIAGQYGDLTIHPDGAYSYIRYEGMPGNVSDVFTYTLTDGDGDSATATLTITSGNTLPTIGNLTPAAEGGDVTVNESHLADGSNPNAAALTQPGSFTISAPDGVGNLTIDGHAVISNGVFTPDSFTTGLGNTLAVTGYNPATGEISYTYTLTDNETHAAGQGTNSLFENLDVVLTDLDGDSTQSTLAVNIVDDVPVAVNDVDSIASGVGPATGNVITDAEGDGGADTRGADGAAVTAVASNNVPANSDGSADGSGNFQVAGQYGVLTLHQNGDYSYTRNEGTPGNVSDVFTYTLTDGDGDSATATLTITIGNTLPTIGNLTPAAEGGDVAVNESHLADGSDPNAAALTQPGNFTISAPDGVGNLTIDGHPVINNGAFTPGSFTTGLGNTLTITGYDSNTGTVSYTYTLTDNETHAAVQGTNSLFENLDVVLTDLDGDSTQATLAVNIIDDVPAANPDTNAVMEGGVVSGNVLTDGVDDVFGADGPAAAGGVVGVRAAGGNTTSEVTTGVGSTITGQYGTLTLNANGGYTYDGNPNEVPPAGANDVFVYTIQDSDGDRSTTTLTITLTDSGLTASNKDITVNEAALPSGSDPNSSAETAAGTLTGNVSGGAAGYSFTLIGSGTGTYGSLTLNASGSYSYTLTQRYDTTPDANDGPNIENNRDTFTYQVTDANGNTATNTLTIDIIDDVPHAVADEFTVVEGSTINGNVLTEGTDDVFGADGKEAAGGVVGVRAAGGNTSSEVTTGVGSTITGQYGTLTLGADGNFIYQAAPNQITQGATDTFVYTIQDGDGDRSTTTLTIHISDAGVTAPDDRDITVYENALDTVQDGQDLASSTFTGSLPSSPNETGSGQLNGSASTSISYALNGAVAAGDGSTTLTGTYGVIKLQANGSYVYTLTSPANATGTNDGPQTQHDAEFFTYTVKDAHGNTAEGKIYVNIVDDVPAIDVAAANESGVVLTTQDADTLGANFDTASSTANFGGVFSIASSNYGADGAGTAPALSYTLGFAAGFTEGSASGMTSNGAAINLWQLADGTIVGATGTEPATANAANVVFSLSVSGTGVVTLTQYQELDHDAPGATAGPYDGQYEVLANGLVTLTATATITDGDGDSATDSETVDLGGNIRFADDGPAIDVAAANESGVVLTTQDADTLGANFDTASSTANFGGVFSIASSNYGADGAGTAPALSYTLGFAAGFTEGSASGMTSNGAAINLWQLADGTIVGATGTEPATANAANVVFSLSVSGTGVVTLTQYQELDHDAPGTTAGPYDGQYEVLANGLVTLTATATITDGDGDSATDSETVDLGGNIRFADDGPAIDVAAANESGVVLTTQDADTLGANFDTASSTAAFGGVFSIASSNYGADGAGTAPALSYTLGFAAGFTEGSALGDDQQRSRRSIYGNLADGTIVGATGTEPATANAANVVFSLSVSGTGVVTLTQYQELDHDAPGTTAGPYDGQYEVLANGLVTLTATATITDGDGDSATDSETVDLGGNIRFADDGPAIDVAAANESGVVLTTQDADTLGANFDTASSTANFGGVFSIASSNYGADGAGTAPALSYTLGFAAGFTEGSASGMTSNGAAINLWQLADGTIVGATGTEPATANAANVVFSLSVSGTGVVTLTQYQELDHDAPGATAGPYDGQYEVLANGLVTLTATATITDGDGDSATDSETVDLGGNIRFADDGPAIDVAAANESGVVLTTQDADTLGANFDTASSTANFGGVFSIASSNYGADGAGTAPALSYTLGFCGRLHRRLGLGDDQQRSGDQSMATGGRHHCGCDGHRAGHGQCGERGVLTFRERYGRSDPDAVSGTRP